MVNNKFRYNKDSLTFEKVDKPYKLMLANAIKLFVVGGIFASLFLYFFSYSLISSPKETILREKMNQLCYNMQMQDKKLSSMHETLKEIEYRDDNIYRVIFEADPIAPDVREAGFGGTQRYKQLEGYINSNLFIRVNKNLDRFSNKLYIQSKSFDEVCDLVVKKNDMIASIPSILPLSVKYLKKHMSGFGMRRHPILNRRIMHTGIDLGAPNGTKIYATGKGVISKTEYRGSGYGINVRIDHGYKYSTVYAHCSKILVEVGDSVQRGDVIALVGNTGLSTCPHLHYEVRKNNRPINPINFFNNDLTPKQYDEIVELSSNNDKTL